MKKKGIIAAAFLSFTMAFSVSAQTTFGLKLSGNLTNVSLTSKDESNGKFHPGVSFGGFVKTEIGRGFSVQPELSLKYTEAKLRTSYEKTKYKYAAVEIPVYVQKEFRAGTGKILIGAGPHIGYGLSADIRTEKLPEGSPFENVIELDHWYAGGGISTGYEFKNKISVNGGYQLSYDFSSRKKTSRIRTQTISLGIGYRF
ncbi:MAG: PorT family protein [Rikenellaceae bacterium]|nr:PorT family protein [Rikenellaceae bacterium]